MMVIITGDKCWRQIGDGFLCITIFHHQYSSPSFITIIHHHHSSPSFITIVVPERSRDYNRFFPWTKAPAPRIDA